MRMSSTLSPLVFLISKHYSQGFSNTATTKIVNRLLKQHRNTCRSSSELHLSCFQSTIAATKTALFANTVEEKTYTVEEKTTTILKEHNQEPFKVNLLTVQESELELLLTSWDQPKYRAKQILTWVHEKGISDINKMNNIPKPLRAILKNQSTIGSLNLDVEEISKDGTIKRAYKLWDGQYIESVLMPYDDGRQTACISSQAGCAMGCIFCATGQMGFARQLTADEIFEQVARFSSELKKENKRLSNVVMMGMGEPLANYRNVMEAIRRMNTDLGIGARKITVSTVGVVPNIRKLMKEDIQVRLAVSLHCSSDEERSRLLPANKRYGGLDELMRTIKEYIDVTNRRVTLEWALIENENDTPEVARQLGHLLTTRFDIRRDMVHINLIPLNPTGGFQDAKPSGRQNVDQFVHILDKEFGLTATPRVRRGIDINAGCGQLKAAVQKKERKEVVEELQSFVGATKASPVLGVYEDDYDINHTIENHLDESNPNSNPIINNNDGIPQQPSTIIEQDLTTTTTTIIDQESLTNAYRRRKKLFKSLKAITKLKDMHLQGKIMNEEQLAKMQKEREWLLELESVEHNLQ